MNNYLNLLITAGISMIFLTIVFIPMEKVFPANASQKIIRKHWVLDFCYFLGQYLIWNSIVLSILMYFNVSIQTFLSQTPLAVLKSQPLWLQAIEVLVFSDFIIYWGHRFQHKIDFLWRFHKVHHSAKHLDWLAAHREHPIDSIYTVGLINLPAFVIGFDLNAIAMIIAFRGIWAIFIHSNVRIKLGPLKKIIGSPDLHHWHHDIERDRGNYANISPIMDLLFGTYVCPDHEPSEYGIKEKFPQNYVGQMVQPLFPLKIWKKISRTKHEKQ
jgi:sterol desaturase/sphingolipid hydroxylase (fatty acid hydroxylase superfamily)